MYPILRNLLGVDPRYNHGFVNSQVQPTRRPRTEVCIRRLITCMLPLGLRNRYPSDSFRWFVSSWLRVKPGFCRFLAKPATANVLPVSGETSYS